MAEVDRTGTFRCCPVDTGMMKSSGGFAQFTAQVRLLEYWDEDEKIWIPWEEYEQEIGLYATLFGNIKKTGKLGPTPTHTQISKVFNWDGTDFGYLNDTDFSDLKFQVRIEDNDPDYADKNPFVANWVAEYDAIPGRKMKKLDAAGVKDLNKQFALLLKKTGKTAAPATKTTKIATKDTKKKTQTEAAKTKTPTAPPKAPPKTVAGKPTMPEGKCTKQEAWETVVEMKDDSYDDVQLTAAWHAAIATTAPNIEEGNITDEQWFLIRDAVLDDVGKF